MTKQLGLFDGRCSNAPNAAVTPLSIRESAKARRLTLRLLPPHTLEVVVPRGTRPAKVQAFVAQHQNWIERARQELATRYVARDDRLPTSIELLAVGQEWKIRYSHVRGMRPRCRVGNGELEIRTQNPEFHGARTLLRSWLLGHAKTCLTPWLLREAAAIGRGPDAVQIRLQRTRWGSCSSSGSISLNASLLFVAPPLVRYLLVHELCHLFSMNHSRRFWNAVAQFEPDYRVLDRKLTAAWALIPLWAQTRESPSPR